MDPVTSKMALQLAASVARSRTLRRLLVAVAVIQAAALAVLLFLPYYLGAAGSGALRRVVTAPAGCAEVAATTTTPTGPAGPLPDVRNLTAVQVRVARTVYTATVAVGKAERWSAARTERAFLVATATAMQESTLGAAPGIDRPNGDGDAGVFQQRTLPGWYGSLKQVTDPAYAARTFLLGHRVTADGVRAARANGTRPAGPAGYLIPGLTSVRGWESLPVTVAAQRVQRSAFPDAYAKHEPIARTLLAVFRAKVDTASVEAAVLAESVQCGPPEALACNPSTKPAGPPLAVQQGLRPDTVRVLRCVHAKWPQIVSWAGIGDRPANVDSDHQEGRALDVMIPGYQSAEGQQLGQQIADWVVANRAKLGVRYVIWDEQIWNVQRAGEGWRRCGTAAASCYNGPNDTAAHRDHVHVSTYGDTAGSLDGAATASVSSASMSSASSDRAVLPVNGPITSTFGQCGGMRANCHTGLDLGAPNGAPLRAAVGGTVTAAGDCRCAYGNLTKIRTNAGLELWYAHQSAVRVQVGQRVRAGQLIGAVGATGNVTGPHLHLEVRVKGSPTDPLRWLRARGVLND